MVLCVTKRFLFVNVIATMYHRKLKYQGNIEICLYREYVKEENVSEFGSAHIEGLWQLVIKCCLMEKQIFAQGNVSMKARFSPGLITSHLHFRAV